MIICRDVSLLIHSYSSEKIKKERDIENTIFVKKTFFLYFFYNLFCVLSPHLIHPRMVEIHFSILSTSCNPSPKHIEAYRWTCRRRKQFRYRKMKIRFGMRPWFWLYPIAPNCLPAPFAYTPLPTDAKLQLLPALSPAVQNNDRDKSRWLGWRPFCIPPISSLSPP